MSNSASFHGYSDLPETIYAEYGSLAPEARLDAHNHLPEVVSYSELPETIYVEHGRLPPEINLKAHHVLPEATSFERSDTDSTTNDFGKTEDSTKMRRRRRTKLVWISVITVLIVMVGVGLGVGLGIGLRRHDSTQSSQSAGQTQTSPSLSQSTRGVFNGTGIVTMGRDVYLNLTAPPTPELLQNSGDGSNIVVFYQHHSGDLRWMSCEWPNIWRGGTLDEVVAVDAKNGTALTANDQSSDGVLRTHLFYIDRDNFVRQRTIDNASYSWSDGPLNAMNLKALDSDHVGLKACFYMGPIANADLTGTSAVTGIRLFVASSETTFQQLAWRPGMPKWIWEQSWQNQNGHANPGCYGWGKDQITYTMFVDVDDNIELYWKDTSGAENTDTHPINAWTKSSVNLGVVDPTMGLVYRSNLWGKLPGEGVHSWNISFAAENTSVTISQLNEVDGKPPMQGSDLSVWAIDPASTSPDVLGVFYQTEGDDITMYTGVLSTGIWNETRVPIPDD